MSKIRKPRALTLTLPHANQPNLLFENTAYPVRNFSEEGIGIRVPEPPPGRFAKGARFGANLLINKNVYPVELEVTHQSPRWMGLKFLRNSDELTATIKKLLEPSLYAADLLPHPESGTEDPLRGQLRLWYVGKSGVELLVWYHEYQKTILGLRLAWAGKWVCREQLKPATGGYSPDGSNAQSEIPLHDSPLLIEATQFLASVPPPLPATQLWQFLSTGEQVVIPDFNLEKLKAAG
jgi:hypothetical protein